MDIDVSFGGGRQDLKICCFPIREEGTPAFHADYDSGSCGRTTHQDGFCRLQIFKGEGGLPLVAAPTSTRTPIFPIPIHVAFGEIGFHCS